MPIVAVDGSSLFYTDHPAAMHDAAATYPAPPPLVLLHGAGGSHLHWPPHLRRLARRRVLALDLPGHGRSTGAADAIEAYAAALHAWAAALDLPPFCLGGLSMGALIALTYALDHSERLAGLVLIGGAAHMRVHPSLFELLNTDFDAATARITRLSYSPDAGADLLRLSLQRLRQTDPAVLTADFAACNAFSAAGRLAEIAAPALVLCGSADRMAPPSQSEALAAGLPRAELHFVERAGHMVTLEQPAAVTAHIAAFLDRLSDG